MAGVDWTDDENRLIVADYFAMLADDCAGHPYSKTEHRRALLPYLHGRTEGSIEFKHQNISAVLKGFGETWISGYKPAFNFQTSLEDAVAEWLARNPAWTERRQDRTSENGGLHEPGSLWIGPAPTRTNQPPPQ